MPRVGERFARVGGFRQPSLHVKSCSAMQWSNRKKTSIIDYTTSQNYTQLKESRGLPLIQEHSALNKQFPELTSACTIQGSVIGEVKPGWFYYFTGFDLLTHRFVGKHPCRGSVNLIVRRFLNRKIPTPNFFYAYVTASPQFLPEIAVCLRNGKRRPCCYGTLNRVY